MAKSATYTIRGELNWAKIVGPPVINKFTEEKEWTVDVTPNAASRAIIKKAGIADRLKEPKATDSRKESFISLKQKQSRVDAKTGETITQKPIPIVKVSGEAWDGSKIGNGSVGDILIKVNDYGPGKKRGVYIQKVRILKHIPYGDAEFEPLSEDDEFFGQTDSTEFAEEADVVEDDLDDDVPF